MAQEHVDPAKKLSNEIETTTNAIVENHKQTIAHVEETRARMMLARINEDKLSRDAREALPKLHAETQEIRAELTQLHMLYHQDMKMLVRLVETLLMAIDRRVPAELLHWENMEQRVDALLAKELKQAA